MPHLELSVLGALRMTLDGQPLTGFESAKARALLVYLALEPNRPHSRDALAGLLWPEHPNQVARDNLRQTLANLRRVIGDRNSSKHLFLSVTRDAVQFNVTSDHSLDAVEFTVLLARCSNHFHRHHETCRVCAEYRQQAAELYRGDFLDQFFLSDSAPFEEWALLQRENLRRLALDLLAALAEYHERRGRFGLALQSARRQLQLDPWREEAHRQLMRLLALNGQRRAALSQYETCRRILADEMNAEPSEETTALYATIRRAREGISALSPSSPPPSNFPAPMTGFVGRQTELSRLDVLLTNPACRLITLLGPGGIGKTRLALQAAVDEAVEFRDGVFFVPLALINARELIAPAMLAALGARLQGPRDPKEQLLDYLRGREVLLVLDNLEHLLAEADLLTNLLARAPGVTLLVTSRERLNLQSEWVFDLQGLEVPKGATSEEIEKYSAVQLFLQAARRSRADYSLFDEERATIVRICHLVEGVPLAIELAAAWVRSLSCRQIAEEIEKSFGFLSTTLRDVPERHRSMRAVFEHSWKLLAPEERHALSGLSAFNGGFTQNSAEAIAGADLSLLTELMTKSLVHLSGAERYDLHDLIRQFALEKLYESGEMRRVRDRHLTYFLALAEEADPHLYDSEQKEWLRRLECDHDNLRAGLRWAIESQDAERALRLANALWRFWYVHGHFLEGLLWFKQVLALSTGLQTADRAKGLNSIGVFAYLLGERAEARTYYEASLELSRQLNNRARLTGVLNNLGMLARMEGNCEQAVALFEEVLALSRELDDQAGVATALNNLGITWLQRGDLSRAKALQEQNLVLRRERGDTWGIATALVNLSTIATYEEDYARGAQWAEEALVLNKEIGHKRGVAIGLKDLARLARYQGQGRRSRELLDESLPLLRQLGDKLEITSCLLGFVADSIERGRFERGAVLLGAIDRLVETVGEDMDRINRAEYDRERAALQRALGDAAFAAAWEQGRARDMEQAIAFACCETE
jgi:predicted ATPase/DNA-binding SARP family transcriptional activator